MCDFGCYPKQVSHSNPKIDINLELHRNRRKVSMVPIQKNNVSTTKPRLCRNFLSHSPFTFIDWNKTQVLCIRADVFSSCIQIGLYWRALKLFLPLLPILRVFDIQGGPEWLFSLRGDSVVTIKNLWESILSPQIFKMI